MKTMVERILVLLLLVSGIVAFCQSANGAVPDFDRYYPPYDEIIDFINSIDSPIVSTEAFGSSDVAMPRTLMAVRISDNPTEDEDEPGFLFIGNIHGNEPLGVRVILELIEMLTELYDSDEEIQNWVNAYEIWIVPVLNPYGYDNSFRKNGPNTTDDTTTGVDLNRNFDFRWDTWPYEPPDDNTFRGPSAASEPETQAISSFVMTHRPAFGITLHSGSGGAAGLIYAHWNDIPPSNHPDPPDEERYIAIGEVIAEAIEDFRGGNKPTVYDTGSLGQSTVYHHAVTGMFDYMLETSNDKWNRDTHAFFYDMDLDDYEDPELAELVDAEEYVNSSVAGIEGLLRHFLFDATSVFTFRGPGISGQVTDCLTGDPLPATVKILELDDTDNDGDVDDDDRDLDTDGDLDTEFRTAEPSFGRYLRLLPQGTWTVEFSQAGYVATTTSVTVVDLPAGVPLIDLDTELDPGTDSDVDGLTDCEESGLGTDPFDSDSDDDGLTDGEEVNDYGTDPRNSDSDDDGLSDGEEVNDHGTDPLDSDSDDDGLTDGDEVNLFDTDPLDDDSDDDGLMDSGDVEFIQNFVNRMPEEVFKGNSPRDHRTAINSILDDVEVYLLTGETDNAVRLLQNLRRHLDGGKNDWVIYDEPKEMLRNLIDLLIANI